MPLASDSSSSSSSLLHAHSRLAIRDLMLAAARNDLHGLQHCIIDLGIDVNISAGNGITALRTAIVNGSVAAVDWLLTHGARVNETDRLLRTPLHHACERGLLDIALKLIAAGANIHALTRDRLASPLHYAAREGSVGVISALVAAGARLEARDEYGATPLFIACYWGKEEAVSTLLQRGANVDAGTHAAPLFYRGAYPLHVAADFAYDDVVRTLLRHNADVSVEDSARRTPLDVGLKRLRVMGIMHTDCQRQAYRESVRALIRAGTWQRRRHLLWFGIHGLPQRSLPPPLFAQPIGVQPAGTACVTTTTTGTGSGHQPASASERQEQALSVPPPVSQQ